jgi:hypothetical protein
MRRLLKHHYSGLAIRAGKASALERDKLALQEDPLEEAEGARHQNRGIAMNLKQHLMPAQLKQFREGINESASEARQGIDPVEQCRNESFNRNGHVINIRLIESYVASIQQGRRLPSNEYFITK